MVDARTLGPQHLGARLAAAPRHIPDAWLRQADVLVRVVHEHDLRDGTFVGFGRPGDDPGLQTWGTLVPAATPTITLDSARPAPAPGTAGALTYADLSGVSGTLLAPAVPGVEERRARDGGTWHLAMVDHRAGHGGASVTLSYRWADPHADRGILAPYFFRVTAAPDTRMVPAGPAVG